MRKIKDRKETKTVVSNSRTRAGRAKALQKYTEANKNMKKASE